MNKVAILTLGGRYNYGNRLQNYASDRVWRKAGFDPTSLFLSERPNAVRRIKSSVRKLLGREIPSPEAGITDARFEAFDRFNDHMVMATLSDIDCKLAEDYQFFSVGSDQVWNPYLIAYNEDWFFLEFAKPDQRIALAPSIGLDVLSPKHSKVIRRGLSNFKRVSIRESRGAELIKECAGIDAEVVCDPTLTLSAAEWRAVADGRCTPAEPYVFTYLLGGVSSEASGVLDKVTDHGRIPVIPLSDRQKPEEPDAGPAEFIDLIDHASHVVTDSFHAAVFSSILQTPLTITHREGGASMFSRLEQLSVMLGIEEKVCGSLTYDLARAGEYEGVPEAISDECEKFMAYLEGCLND